MPHIFIAEVPPSLTKQDLDKLAQALFATIPGYPRRDPQPEGVGETPKDCARPGPGDAEPEMCSPPKEETNGERVARIRSEDFIHAGRLRALRGKWIGLMEDVDRVDLRIVNQGLCAIRQINEAIKEIRDYHA